VATQQPPAIPVKATSSAPPLPGTSAANRIIYGIAIFASALLLFEVEPIIAKIILPWFGGVAAVWAVCLLFFQVVLLLGYSYAHLLTRWLPLRGQGHFHAVLLLASLLLLRIAPRDAWKPAGPGHPVLRILLLLCATVGLPYFLLSTTSPLLQAWYARTLADTEPYRFYALSNAGSVLALLSYPVLIEPYLSTSHQALGWSLAYGAFVLLSVAIALVPRAGKRNESSARSKSQRPAASLQLLWLGLAACGSGLLLAVTNHISQNIASVPFLWILPLSLYLLSFILCFDARGWYRREFFLRLLGIAIGGMTYALAPSFAGLPWKALIVVYCLGLFICCMFCHGELARLKPAPEHLTSFYLALSLGGAMGALFVALVAPRIFSGYYELHCLIGLCAVLVLIVHYRDPSARNRGGLNNPAWLVMAGLAAIVITSLFVTAREQAAGARLMVRNFYGVLRIIDGIEPNVVLLQGNRAQSVDKDPHYRKLMNGTIDHGLQFLAPGRRREPTTYYGPKSGVGIALEAARRERALRVGAIGLGIGTVATYGQKGDQYTFYEINPLVVKVAKEEFTFLRDSEAQIDIVLGDARLSLEGEAPEQFDVLIVDAFSGDSIPVHLLTQEAFALYFRQVKPDGVLAVHISNQYLNLEPVVAGEASWLGREAVIVDRDVENNKGVYPATWILVGNRDGFLGESEIEKAGHLLPPSRRNAQLWTDNYSSVWRLLK
jgi:SAM-dependent methyltransferase